MSDLCPKVVALSGDKFCKFFCVHWRCRFRDKFNSMVDALFLCSSNVSPFSSERCHFLVSSRANSQPTITMIYSTSLIQLDKCKYTEYYSSQPLGCIMPYLTQSLQLHVQVYCSLLEQWTLSLSIWSQSQSLLCTTLLNRLDHQIQLVKFFCQSALRGLIDIWSAVSFW